MSWKSKNSHHFLNTFSEQRDHRFNTRNRDSSPTRNAKHVSQELWASRGRNALGTLPIQPSTLAWTGIRSRNVQRKGPEPWINAALPSVSTWGWKWLHLTRLNSSSVKSWQDIPIRMVVNVRIHNQLLKRLGKRWGLNTCHLWLTRAQWLSLLRVLMRLATVNQLTWSHWATHASRSIHKTPPWTGPSLLVPIAICRFLFLSVRLGKSGAHAGTHLLLFLINTLHSKFIPWMTNQASEPFL